MADALGKYSKWHHRVRSSRHLTPQCLQVSNEVQHVISPKLDGASRNHGMDERVSTSIIIKREIAFQARLITGSSKFMNATAYPSPTIRIMVVEDDPQMLSQIVQMVSNSGTCSVVCAAKNCAETHQFLDNHSMDVMLVDLSLPDGSGLDLIKKATLLHPMADVMVITVFGDESNVFKALENGASGYLLKDSLPEDFLGVIKLLRAGGAPINPIIARKIVKRFRRSAATPTASNGDSKLTEREIEILNLIARGFSTSEAASLCNLSPHTVIAHIKKVYRKLRVNSRSEALYEANLLGILSK